MREPENKNIFENLNFFSPYSSEYQLLLTLAHLRNQKLLPPGNPVLPTFSNPALFSPVIRKGSPKL